MDRAPLAQAQSEADNPGRGHERRYPAADLCGGVCGRAAHVHGLHARQHQQQCLDSLCPGREPCMPSPEAILSTWMMVIVFAGQTAMWSGDMLSFYVLGVKRLLTVPQFLH